MKEIDRRVQRTKNVIRNAFIELIQTKEYQSITITELSSMANIDRKTFYLHYSSIDDLLKEFLLEAADAVYLLLKPSQPFNINIFFNGLRNIMEGNITFYRNISTTTSCIFFLNQCKNILKSFLKDSFYIKSGLTENIFDIYSEYFSAGIIGIYTNWFITNSEMSLIELADYAIDAVTDAWGKITCNH